LNFLKIKNNINDSSGFTLVETLIAITLISLIGIPVFTVFSDTVSFSRRVKDLNRWNKELIQIERVLRKSAREVQIPFWISEIGISKESDSLIVPYWKGDKNSVLEINNTDTYLEIITPEGSTVFKEYNRAEFDILKDSRSRTIGISVRVKKLKREAVEFQCAFGAIGREIFNE